MTEEKAKELVPKKVVRRPEPRWDMDTWFDESLLRPFAPFGFSMPRIAEFEELVPSVDIFDDKGDLVVKAELPGISKDDIDVTLSDGSITISGEKKKENEIKKKDYYKWERSYGSFCRTFRLPSEVKTDKVTSTFKDGVLEVRMPKSEEAKNKEVKVKIQ